MVDLKNNKVFKVIKNIWFAVASVLAVTFIVIMCISCSRVNKPNNNNVNTDVGINEVVKSRVNPKYVSYDDLSYSITLTADELSYTYENFYQFYVDNTLYNYTYLSFTSNAYNYDRVTYYDINGFRALNTDDLTYVKFNLNNENTSSGLYNFTFDSDIEYLIIGIDSSIYEGVKTAIEQDIAANTRNIYSGNGIFDTISSSMVAFIGSLSSGITAMVGVFYNNGALTVIGLLSVIVVAVSLAYFLFRLFIGLIRMRG